MSIPERVFNLGKTYLHRVKDRIDAELTEREQAMNELDTRLGDDRPPARRADTSESGYDSSPDALMRRAEERIAAARRVADSRADLASALDGNRASDVLPTSATTSPATETDPNASDYRVLGLPVAADLSAVQAAYEMLTRRCDPRRFPEGSQEQKDAERILARVNTAYEALRKRLDPTENRFGKLEFE